MKIEKNIFFGMDKDIANKTHKALDKKTVFAGDMNIDKVSNNMQSKIDEKRVEARKRISKVIGDVFSAEKSIDDNIISKKKHAELLKGQIVDAQKNVDDLDAKKTELMKQYGVSENSMEHQDLLLIERRNEALKTGKEPEFSEEEYERLRLVDENGTTEYQSRALEYESYKEPYTKLIDNNRMLIKADNETVEAIKLERLKSHPMYDAKQEAETIEKVAEASVKGMILDEAIEYIDNNIEEDVKKGEELQKEADEKEEHIEEVQRKNVDNAEKAEKERQEDNNNDIITDMLDDITHVSKSNNKVKSEVSRVLSDMKLIEEDVKGITVDSQI